MRDDVEIWKIVKALESAEMESQSDGDCLERVERRERTHWREQREESESERGG